VSGFIGGHRRRRLGGGLCGRGHAPGVAGSHVGRQLDGAEAGDLDEHLAAFDGVAELVELVADEPDPAGGCGAEGVVVDDAEQDRPGELHGCGLVELDDVAAAGRGVHQLLLWRGMYGWAL
jgi:hypothetical protein